MKPAIGISESNLSKSIRSLTAILSDEMTLYVKTRKFHWNVSGESFMELHKLFENEYEELEERVDSIAERINKLGGKTIGTMKEFISSTRIKESPGNYPLQRDMMNELMEDHESIIKLLRKDIDECSLNFKDIGTADFLTGIMEKHETTAWILRRYLM